MGEENINGVKYGAVYINRNDKVEPLSFNVTNVYTEEDPYESMRDDRILHIGDEIACDLLATVNFDYLSFLKITGVWAAVRRHCKNKRVIHLAEHSKSRRVAHKNLKRAIGIALRDYYYKVFKDAGILL